MLTSLPLLPYLQDLIAIVGVGAALSLAAALVELDIPGRVKLLGTPAEEAGGGKVIMIKEGAYDDMTGTSPMNSLSA